MEKSPSFDGRIVHEGDIADGRAEARTEDAQARVTLLLQPTKAATRIVNRLAIGLDRQTDIGTADLVGALVPLGHAPIVIGHAHFQSRDSEPRHPFAKPILSVPFGVPVGQDKDSASLWGLDWQFVVVSSGPQTRVNSVVFRPRRFDRTRERQHVFAVQLIVGRRGCGEPVALCSMACSAYWRTNSAGFGSRGSPPMCSSPHSKGCTRRLSSVVQRRCSYRRILRSNQCIESPALNSLQSAVRQEKRRESDSTKPGV